VREAVSALQRLADASRTGARSSPRGRLSEAQWRVLDQIAEEDFMPSLVRAARARSAAAVSR
jgi:hypothetical protein